MTSTATRRGLACATLLVALQVGAAVGPVAASAADCHGRSCAGGAGKDDAGGTGGRPADPGRPAEPGRPADPGPPAPPPPATPPEQAPVAPPPPLPVPPPPGPVDPAAPADVAPPVPAAPPTGQERPSGPPADTAPDAENRSPLGVAPQDLLAQLPPEQALAVAEDRVASARRLLAAAEADAATVAEQVLSDREPSGDTVPRAARRGGGGTAPAPGQAAPATAPSEAQPSPFDSTSAQSDRAGYDTPVLLLLVVVGWLGASALATVVVAALGRAGSSEDAARFGP